MRAISSNRGLKVLATAVWVVLILSAAAARAEYLEGTKPTRLPADILTIQHDQIDAWFLKTVNATPEKRDRLWQPDFGTVDRYLASVSRHRRNLRRDTLGLLEVNPAEIKASSIVLESEGLTVEDVRLVVDGGLETAALVFFPARVQGAPAVIAVGPEGQTREQFTGVIAGRAPASWLQSLLERGAVVAVPATVDRGTDHPLSRIARGATMDRRCLLFRLGFLAGKTLVGLEVQQVLALRSFLAADQRVRADRIALLGIDQGGMTAFYAAAADPSFHSLCVVDYFQKREGAWKEPVDRVLNRQLPEFGDAEVAALVAPRPMSVFLTPAGPTPHAAVESEAERARRFYRGLGRAGDFSVEESPRALEEAAAKMVGRLGLNGSSVGVRVGLRVSEEQASRTRDEHFEKLHAYVRRVCDESDPIREAHWNLAVAAPEDRAARVAALQAELRQLMGTVPDEGLPLNPRTDLIATTKHFKAYNVLLDVATGVEAWGQLLVPLRLDGRAPIVIAQHGGSGRVDRVTGIGFTGEPLPDTGAYHRYGAVLAEKGYVVFAPFVAFGNKPLPKGAIREDLQVITEVLNPICRKAAAIGMIRTSIEQLKLRKIIDFLETLPFADSSRIGYYGISYGGYSITWMSPLEPRVTAIGISGHFNDWRPKMTSERIATSFLLHPDGDYWNWNVVRRFTHVELIAAMWPRPVFIEYGEHDAVTPPGWFRRAWGKVQAWAQAWNSSHLISHEYFDGGHEIAAVGSFDFLDRYLMPERAAGRDYSAKAGSESAAPPQVKEGDTAAPFATHRLDSGRSSLIRGTFYLSTLRPVFSGLAFRVSRRGNMGDLIVRFGTREGSADVGEARIPSRFVGESADAWHEARILPLRLDPKQLYHFEISAEWGWMDSSYYVFYGPQRAGGKAFAPYFGVSFKTLDEGDTPPPSL